jgi:hypothetical protein
VAFSAPSKNMCKLDVEYTHLCFFMRWKLRTA